MPEQTTSCILIADDDKDIVAAIATQLEKEGYRTIRAYNGLDALEKLSENEVHLILMDVMMPKLDGLSAVMKIRETQNIPILVLSAKTEDTDKILGLSVGADDYMTKPYNPLELSARVRAALRRYLHLGSKQNAPMANFIKTGGLELDTDAKQVYLDGEPIKLTATELKIVELMMRNAGKVFSAEEIYSKIWNEDAYAVENTVMVHIRHIREKIEINPKEPRYLKVVWGIGYKMEKLP